MEISKMALLEQVIERNESRHHTVTHTRDGADFIVFMVDPGTPILYGIEDLILSLKGLDIDWFIEYDEELHRIQMRVYA